MTAPQFESDPSPWVPHTLESLIDSDELGKSWAYIVVDEIVDGCVGLDISPWPWVDAAGRLRFGDVDADELVGVSLEGFQRLLKERRMLMVMARDEALGPDAAQALSERPVRIGDVFAVPRKDPGEWIRQNDDGERELVVADRARIFDITYEAREEAKLAASAAVAPPLDEEEASRFLGEDGTAGTDPEDDGPKGGGGGSKPPDQPRPSGVAPGGEVVPAEQVAEMSVHA